MPRIHAGRRGIPSPAALFICLAGVTAGGLAGCRPAPSAATAAVTVAPGVTFRRDPRAGVQLLDVDLREGQVQPIVVAEHVKNHGGNFVADARTVREWAERYHAIGGINGGFFGDTYDQIGRRKQIVQLAVIDGNIVAPGGVETSGETGLRYVRSAVGFMADGTPDIVWGSGNRRVGPRFRMSPDGQETSRPWQVRYAVACGPRLFAAGVRHITEREERFNSPERVSRAFVAYDWENGRPRHFVLGRADATDFKGVADFLADYFPAAHGTTPREAMCLDGGPSAQVVYRDPASGVLTDAEPTGVMVATAILLLPHPPPPQTPTTPTAPTR